MAVYMITYDIKVTDSFEYPKLYEAIKSLVGKDNYIHPFKSVWFVDTTTLSAEEIMDKLKPFLTLLESNGDTIIVIRCTKRRSGHYGSNKIKWMQSKDRTWDTPAYP